MLFEGLRGLPYWHRIVQTHTKIREAPLKTLFAPKKKKIYIKELKNITFKIDAVQVFVQI
jgi:hypothetical protein